MTSTTDILGDRYRLGRLIGRGGMSDVYEAVDERSGASVAIKIVRSGDPALARRMAQEARALERLNHPGLVRLFDTGLEADQAFLVMELVTGPTLADALRDGPFGAATTAVLGAHLADAMAYVHAQGIVHRDVKPSNILLNVEGGGKLGDFGIARLLDSSTLTVTGTTLGTTAYMAPEQLEDHQVGPSADIWSLGIVLLECLTGRRVYEGTATEVVARRLSGPVPFPDRLPVPWKLVLSGMLDHRPDQRLEGDEVAALLSTSAFAAAWDPSSVPETDVVAPTIPHDLMALAPGAGATSLMDAGHPGMASSPPSVTTPPKSSRRWWGAGLAAMVAVGLALGLGFGLRSHPTTHGHHATGTTVVPPPRTSTTNATTSTTMVPTTVPGAPAALATLIRDLASATEGGTVGSGTATSISDPAQQAVSDEAAGRPNRAASDLQQAAQAISSAVQNGSISGSEGSTLQADLTALADDLGLSAAGSPPTTSSSAGNTGTSGTGSTGGGNTGGGGNGHHG